MTPGSGPADGGALRREDGARRRGHLVTAGRPPRERVLDPRARISEILFGPILALTSTGALDAASQSLSR
jgi:hypothetical protein